MSTRRAFGDFSLLRTANQRFTHSLATAFAYSRQFNFRRLESHTYAPWGLIFNELANILSPQVLCIPQYTYTSSPTTNAASHNDSINTQTPQNYEELMPDFTLLWLAANIRSNIQHSFEQLPLDRMDPFLRRFPADERVPRGYKAVPRTENALYEEPVNWHLLKISRQHSLCIGELKRPAGRRKTKARHFYEDLWNYMFQGMFGAQQQAAMALAVEDDETKRIILIVGVGEWWCFMVFCRDSRQPLYKGDAYAFLDISHGDSARKVPPPDYPRLDPPDVSNPSVLHAHGHRDDDIVAAGVMNDLSGEEARIEEVSWDDSGLDFHPSDSDSGESEFEEGDSSFNHNVDFSAYMRFLQGLPQTTSQAPRKQGRPTAPPARYLDCLDDPKWSAPLVWTLRQALPPPNIWSSPLLYGTPPSNQRMFLISELLKIEVRSLEERFPGTPVPAEDFDFSSLYED